LQFLEKAVEWGWRRIFFYPFFSGVCHEDLAKKAVNTAQESS